MVTAGNPAGLSPATVLLEYPVMMASDAAVLASSIGLTIFDGASTNEIARTPRTPTLSASPRMEPPPSRRARAYIVNPAAATVHPISG